MFDPLRLGSAERLGRTISRKFLDAPVGARQDLLRRRAGYEGKHTAGPQFQDAAVDGVRLADVAVAQEDRERVTVDFGHKIRMSSNCFELRGKEKRLARPAVV